MEKQPPKTLNAEYHLTGVQDMAAGFMFSPEGNFEFFLVYGAMDRFASGTYEISGDTIHLKSKKEPGNDFEIRNQSKSGTGYTIKVVEKNQILAENVSCFYTVNGIQQQAFADQDGVIFLGIPACEKIYVRSELYVDIPTLIKDENNLNNTFELVLKPSLQEVSFKGIDFFIRDDELTCHPNYFLPMQNIRFVRSRS